MLELVLFFRYLKGPCHGNRFCAKMGQNCLPPCTYRCHSETVWDNAVYVRFNSITNASISCKILVKIGPAVSAENWLIEIALRVDVVVRRILSNISRYTRPIFTIFSPHESTLHADDGTVLYFAIGQGTLPWQPIKVEKFARIEPRPTQHCSTVRCQVSYRSIQSVLSLIHI